MMQPLVLDFDESVGPVPKATTLDLTGWQEAIRFGCTMRTFRRLREHLDAHMPAEHGTVLMGSGDYHHISWPLIERMSDRGPFQVIVLDNHPDNMRFPFGVHCGSWVRKVAQLKHVSKVHVLGITSGDIGLAHAWENYLGPLASGKLTYWCMDVEVGWAKYFGLQKGFRRFTDPDALVAAFVAEQQTMPQPTYLTIDKDVLSAEAAHTNWDQGRFLEHHMLQVIEALSGQLVGSDITGEISSWQYSTWWKRRLSAMDGQEPIAQEQLDAWQQEQRDMNARLLPALARAYQVKPL